MLKLSERELSFILFAAITILIHNVLYKVQPTPFIDEVFHIPQALKYCEWNFSDWDPKITTLPGLYIVSFLGHVLLNIPCTLYSLRFFNVLITLLNFCVIHSITSCLHGKGKEPISKLLILWSSINISFFPVLYFFTFLYYTDVFSTFLVLFAYRLELGQYHGYSAFIGLLSVIVRQTNIVWVGYLFLNWAFTFYRNELPTIHRCAQILSTQGVSKLRVHLLKKLKKQGSIFKPGSFSYSTTSYLFVCLLFFAFVYINGGIVVGDKSAHQPVFHLCQLLYFSFFCLIFMSNFFIVKIPRFVKFAVRKFYLLVFFFCVLATIIKYNSLVHIYLISDNRHYSFYLWKRIYEKYSFMRYTLIPLYSYGLFCIKDLLDSSVSKYPYFLAVILCLVPQKLLEFRYFILPYLFLRLQLKINSPWHLALESIFFSIVNFFVIYTYKTRIFYWEDSQDIQRIIW